MFRSAQGSDAQWVARVLGGDREAFGHLVRRYERVVWGVALASLRDFHAAEDVVQEALLKAYRELGTLKQPARFGPWLVQITRNLLVDHSRRAALRAAAPLEDWDAAAEEDPGRRELHRLLREQVLSLPPAFREAILLHYFGGKSAAELAPLLGISRAAAHKRIERARQQLGRQLDEHFSGAFDANRRSGAARKAILAAIAVAPIPARATAPGAAAAPVIALGAWKLVGLLLGLALLPLGWWFWGGAPGAEAGQMAPSRPTRIAAVEALSAREEAEAAPKGEAAPELGVTVDSPESEEDLGVVISGAIKDSHGRTLEGADVIAYATDGFHAETKSGSDGEFLLPWLGAREYTLRVRAAGHLPKTQVVQAPAEVYFSLEPGGTLYCRVLDQQTQAPVQDVVMRLRGKEAVGDSNGFVTMVPEAALYLNPAEEVTFEGQGYFRAHFPQHDLLGDAGQAQAVYLAPMTVITGEVVNRQGEPIPGVGVYSVQPEFERLGETGQDGRFSLEHLDAWPERLLISIFYLYENPGEGNASGAGQSQTFGMAEVQLEPNGAGRSRHYPVVIPGGASLRVHVPRDSEMWSRDRFPGEFRVEAEMVSEYSQERTLRATSLGTARTEGEGTFYFPLLPPGPAQIHVHLSAVTAGSGCPYGQVCHLTVSKLVELRTGQTASMEWSDPVVRLFGHVDSGELLQWGNVNFDASTPQGARMFGWAAYGADGAYELMVPAASEVDLHSYGYGPSGQSHLSRQQVTAPMQGELRVDFE